MARILKLSNWIGGRFLEPSSLKYLENINPYTQEIINLVPSSSLNDVNNAVEVAKNSLERWSNESIQNRANYLLNIANEIEKYTEVIIILTFLILMIIIIIILIRNLLLLNQEILENL